MRQIQNSPSMTVKEAIELLKKCPPDNKLKIWLPGSHIWLVAGTFINLKDRPETTFFEGNVEQGSALCDES